MRLKSLAILFVVVLATTIASAQREPEIVLWPEHQRSFIQDGPGLLLKPDQLEALVGMSSEERDVWIEEFLANDPVPETELNELVFGIERRRKLVHLDYITLVDGRARLLFLNGLPLSRELVDCGQAFVPIEIWTYGSTTNPVPLVLYQAAPDRPYRLWFPSHSKMALYTSEMRYWLQQYEELKGFISARRFDKQLCKKAELDGRHHRNRGSAKVPVQSPDGSGLHELHHRSGRSRGVGTGRHP